MIKGLKRLLAAGALALVVGCSSLGVPAPKGPSQDLAYAYATVASVRQAAAQEVAAGVITPEVAQKVLVATDSARGLLDAGAGALQAGDTVTEGQKLQAAINLLTEVQKLLPAQQKGK